MKKVWRLTLRIRPDASRLSISHRSHSWMSLCLVIPMIIAQDGIPHKTSEEINVLCTAEPSP